MTSTYIVGSLGDPEPIAAIETTCEQTGPARTAARKLTARLPAHRYRSAGPGNWGDAGIAPLALFTR